MSDAIKDEVAQPVLQARRRSPSWWAYGFAIVATGAALLARLALTSWMGDRPVLILFVIPIVLSAYAGGLGPGLLATVLSALATDYFVLPPAHSFLFKQPADTVIWLILVLAGVLISVLSGALHRSRNGSESEPADVELASTERKVGVGFAFALACLGVVGVVSYLSVIRLNENAAWVEHTHEVLSRLDLLLAAVTDAETAGRGYVITGDDSYLEPYKQSTEIVDLQARRLRELTADNRAQQLRLDSVVPLVTGRLAELHAVIELRKNQGFAAAQSEILTGKGKRFHDQIRDLIGRMNDMEMSLLKEREQRAERSAAIAQAVIIGGGFLACGVVGLALLAIRRDFAGRSRAERALRDARDELEVRVQQRTAELALNHERTRAIFETALDGIVTMDHEGRIREFNAAAEGIFGYRRGDVIGRPLAEVIIPAALRERHCAGLARYLATGEAPVLGKRIELPALRADGSEVTVELSINRMPGDGPASFAGFVRDITERQRAAETNARLASIVQYSDDAIVSKNLDGIITSWNPGAERLFGYPAEEALGKPIAMLIPPDRSGEEPAILARIARGVTTDHFETVRIRKDGRKIDVSVTISPIRDGQGRIVGASKIARDITERKLAEAKVQAQLARLNLLQQITRAIGERQDIRSIFQVVIRTLEEHLPVDFCCVCLYDPAEKCLIVTSVGLRSEALAMELAMTEHARIEIDENGLSRCVRGRLVYDPDIGQIPFPFPQRLARGGLSSMVAAPLLVESKVFGVLIAARQQARSFSSGECEFLRQASEHVALATHQAQLYGALQQAYEDLRQTQRALMQQERLLALGQMASGIAHDINNAISPVSLYTESLLDTEPGLSPRTRSHLETIQRAIGDVAKTVARMREFYRPREPQLMLVPVDMNHIVQQVVDLTRAHWSDMAQQRGIAIEMRTELGAELPEIMGADNEIREALTNLIFNAVDAMPGGGPLTLRTRVAQVKGLHPEEPVVHKFVQVEVIDTGIGMDEDTRRRCLEPFFTTKGERGTGLGLAMVYGTVQRHSADIEIESEVGKGTTVRLSFAIPTAPAVGTTMPITPSAAPSLRILVVDDDPLVLKSLRDTLEADGHDVTTADGGQAGIDAFLAAQAQSNPFPVVITDLGMPHVDGRRVSNAVKTAAAETIVLLLTGWGQRLVADGDIPPHVDHVLSKPPKLRELREALVRCLDAQVS
jgi:PAS domain S-box-containing protein